jgi:hypothetical protein
MTPRDGTVPFRSLKFWNRTHPNWDVLASSFWKRVTTYKDVSVFQHQIKYFSWSLY